MKAEDVIMQLNKVLPFYSDRFSNSVGISSITCVGTTATIITSAPHGRSSGDVISLSGVRAPIDIDTMTRDETVITVVTNQDHDLTENYQETVNISGATEPEFNGDFELLTVPNRRTFTLRTEDSGATNSTGSPKLNQDNGYSYNGLHIVTVVSDTEMTFALDKNLGSPAEISEATLATSFRITGANDLSSCIELYTNKDYQNSWAFVVLGSVSASKDRDAQSDAISVRQGNSRYYQQLITNFTVYVLSTTTNSVTSRPIRDEMEDVAVALFKSVCGVKFDSGLSEGAVYKTVFDNHEMVGYRKSIYAHAFNFQVVSTLIDKDIFNENFNVAFRDINLEISVEGSNSDTIKLTSNIDLDEEEL